MSQIVWFRNDLRLEDNEVVTAAIAHHQVPIAFVYIHDENRKLGFFRQQFLKESLRNLKSKLAQFGHELICLRGQPEKVMSQICVENSVQNVYCSSQSAFQERNQNRVVSEMLTSVGGRLQEFENNTLLKIKHLPFKIAELPLVFTTFRKQIEARWPQLASFDSPSIVNPPLKMSLPDQQVYEIDEQVDPRNHLEFKFKGGEDAAKLHMDAYIWKTDSLRTYKETRNHLSDFYSSSKFSPWLALGCISPRMIYHEVKKYERSRGANDSTYWLIFELLWRDYFYFLSLRFGARIFSLNGIGAQKKTRAVTETFESSNYFHAWCEGQTGYPLVDAGMRELKATGWMSNRARQNVASFLVHNLGVDWRRGADWFETHLVDYDPCNNWGNWGYVAGVGTDPRSRIFDVVKQSFDYDPEGDYVRMWVPELAHLNGPKALMPWEFSKGESVYPDRIV